MITPGTLALTTVIVVLVVGTRKLRNIGEDLGIAVKNFKKGLQDEKPSNQQNDES